MKKLLILMILNFYPQYVYAKDMIYIPEDDRDHVSQYFFEVMYSWYDKDGDYVILVDNQDNNMSSFPSAIYKYKFFEIRGIEPQTVKIKQINNEGVYYIGKFKENYDCSKFNFDKIIYKDGQYIELQKQNACFGYKNYSYQDLREQGITLNIIDTYKILKSIKYH